MLKRNECLNPVALPFMTGSHLRVFRCGKCANCLRHKGSTLAVRLFREVHSCPDVSFLTFTYRNSDLPIRLFYRTLNAETGEVLAETSPVWANSGEYFYEHCPGKYLKNKNGKPSKRCEPLVEDVTDVFDLPDVIRLKVQYWSNRAKDTQDALKRFRAKHKVKFKYFSVPEYGGVTYRPHVHMCVVGLSRALIYELVKEWKFGNVDVRFVSASDNDRSSQLAKLSAYVSKYASKGKFDCPYIRSGEALRPRRASSVHFGFGTDSQYAALKRWLLAEDIFGEYDYKHIDPTPDMVSVLSSRRFVDINGYKYPLPELFVKEFFKEKVPYCESVSFPKLDYVPDWIDMIKPVCFKVPYRNVVQPKCKCLTKIYVKSKKWRYLSTPLQKQIATSLLHRVLQDAEERERELFEASQNVCMSDSEFWRFYEDAEQTRVRSAEAAFRSSLLDSLF